MFGRPWDGRHWVWRSWFQRVDGPVLRTLGFYVRDRLAETSTLVPCLVWVIFSLPFTCFSCMWSVAKIYFQSFRSYGLVFCHFGLSECLRHKPSFFIAVLSKCIVVLAVITAPHRTIPLRPPPCSAWCWRIFGGLLCSIQFSAGREVCGDGVSPSWQR